MKMLEAISREEAVQLRVDVENLKLMHHSTIKALNGNENATKENTALLSELLRKMDKHDNREEQREKEIEEIRYDIKEIKKSHETDVEVIKRAKKSQERWDLFFNAMTSKAGTGVLILIIVGGSIAIGLDITKFFK
jgi:1,4-alpha-glucan branching enzyme